MAEKRLKEQQVAYSEAFIYRLAVAQASQGQTSALQKRSAEQQQLVCQLETQQTVMQQKLLCYSALLILTRHAVFSKASEQTARQLAAKVEALKAKLQAGVLERIALNQKLERSKEKNKKSAEMVWALQAEAEAAKAHTTQLLENNSAGERSKSKSRLLDEWEQVDEVNE